MEFDEEEEEEVSMETSGTCVTRPKRTSQTIVNPM
jgi:hypothetical protein